MDSSLNNIPDSKGTNEYYRDESFSKLLEFYSGKDMFSKIESQFIELGEIVGNQLEDLGLTANKNSPKLFKRDRDGSFTNTIDIIMKKIKL